MLKKYIKVFLKHLKRDPNSNWKPKLEKVPMPVNIEYFLNLIRQFLFRKMIFEVWSRSKRASKTPENSTSDPLAIQRLVNQTSFRLYGFLKGHYLHWPDCTCVIVRIFKCFLVNRKMNPTFRMLLLSLYLGKCIVPFIFDRINHRLLYRMVIVIFLRISGNDKNHNSEQNTMIFMLRNVGGNII